MMRYGLILLCAMTWVALASGTKADTVPTATVPTASVPTANVPTATTPSANGGVSETPISPEQSQAFYKQCRDNPTSLHQLTPPQRDYFCTCLATGLESQMTVEDVRDMRDTKTKIGRAALSKMMAKVYFPCAMRPIEENVRNECMTRAAANPSFATGGKKYCGCLASRMIGYVKKVGVAEALYRITTTGEVMEPMDALTSGGGYSQEMIRGYYTCFNGVIP